MGLAGPIRDYVDTLVHASARGDALTAARHRAFIAPRLFASLIAVATFPIYIALCGAPSALEVMVLAWLVTPVIVVYDLSRTGDYERAQMLSATSLIGFAATIAVASGGIGAFAAIWLAIVPLEAALAGSPRLAVFASALAFGAAGLLTLLQIREMLPPPHAAAHVLGLISVISAALYGTALAFGAQSLARATARVLRAHEDRYNLLACHMTDAVTRHDSRGAILFASPAAATLSGAPVGELLGNGLLDRVHAADRPSYLAALADAAEFGHPRSVDFRMLRARQVIWVEMRCEPLVGLPGAVPGRREVIAVMRDMTEHKEQERAIKTLRADIEQANSASIAFLSLVSREHIQKSRQDSADKPDNRVKTRA